MLEVILESLKDLLNIQNVSLTNSYRIIMFKYLVKNNYFTRKEYLRIFKDISSTAASHDLKFAFGNKLILLIGDKDTSRYKYE